MTALADSVLHTVLSIYSQAIAGMKVKGHTEFPHAFFTQVLFLHKNPLSLWQSRSEALAFDTITLMIRHSDHARSLPKWNSGIRRQHPVQTKVMGVEPLVKEVCLKASALELNFERLERVVGGFSRTREKPTQEFQRREGKMKQSWGSWESGEIKMAVNQAYRTDGSDLVSKES